MSVMTIPQSGSCPESKGGSEQPNSPDNRRKDSQDQETCYVLNMFPYPSGKGMHVGHVSNYTIASVYSRFKKLQGKSVIFPIGFDSFGLPTETFALKNEMLPSEATDMNIANFKRQFEYLGLGYDRDREIRTSDPEYYLWTQKLFIQMYENDLVYLKEDYVNRDPLDKTVVANDQILSGGTSERSGAKIIQKRMLQWSMRTTKYAERLVNDLDKVDYPEKTKKRQKDYIGIVLGREYTYDVELLGENRSLSVFLDQSLGLDINDAEAFVLAPEHPFLENIKQSSLEEYNASISGKTNIKRAQQNNPEFIPLGISLTLPDGECTVPVYVSDFIGKNDINRSTVVFPEDIKKNKKFKRLFDSKDTGGEEHKTAILTNIQHGIKKHKLQDQSLSRQRFWGTPIPMAKNKKTGEYFPLPKEHLPLIVPTLTLEQIINRDYPKMTVTIDGHECIVEYEVMDATADSMFYFLRFLDPRNLQYLISPEIARKISSVDVYIGGNEHTTGHLLVARALQKFLYDEGVVFDDEPFKKVIHQGMILGENGKKMSKRDGSGVTVQDLIDQNVDSDLLKLSTINLGPYDQDKLWNKEGQIQTHFNYLEEHGKDVFVESLLPTTAKGARKFINNLIELSGSVTDSCESVITDDLVKAILAKYDNFKFHTITSLFSKIIRAPLISKEDYEKILIMLHPLIPETTTMLRKDLGNTTNLSVASWPSVAQETQGNNVETKSVMIGGKKIQGLSVSLPTNISTGQMEDKEVITDFLSELPGQVVEEYDLFVDSVAGIVYKPGIILKIVKKLD